ncbi:MAG: IS21 family transposase, partial [Bryobacterales bacterium]|nr:IS21 family transposase [Bryobacterales bacterium]
RGKSDGTRAMIEVLRLGREHGYERVRQAVEQALAMGGSDVGLIRYLLKLEGLETRPAGEALEVGWLSRYERPLPNLQDYDRLLSGAAGVVQ